MPDIHVFVGEDEQSVYPEEQIPEMLAQGVLRPDIYYWREGMTQWRPLSAFKNSALSVVPLRRTAPLPEFSSRPLPPQREVSLPVRESAVRTSSRRFKFRRPPEPLSTVVQVLLIVMILVTFMELMAGTAGSMQPDNSSSAHTADLFQILKWSGIGLNVVLLFFYCFWIFRTNLNCRHFSSVVTFTPKWAVGCHFVPVMNLIRPYQAMQEIWKVSGDPRTWQKAPPSKLVAVWWTVALLTVFLSEASFFFADTPHETAIFIGLKISQIAWYGLFLTVITLVLRMQLKLVRSSVRRKEKVFTPPSDDLLPKDLNETL